MGIKDEIDNRKTILNRHVLLLRTILCWSRPTGV